MDSQHTISCMSNSDLNDIANVILDPEKSEISDISDADVDTDEFVAVDEAASADDPQFIEHMKQQAELESKFSIAPEFPYNYESEESITMEIDDWYDYKDNHLLERAKQEFLAIYGEWKPLTTQKKQTIIKELIDNLYKDEYPINELLCLCYISQGTFHESSSIQNHVTSIKSNGELIGEVFPSIYLKCCKLIDEKFVDGDMETGDQLSSSNIDLDTSILLALTILYMTVQSQLKRPKFVKTLSTLETPILTYLVNLTGRLKWFEKPDSILPVRKLTMLMWKCILCLFGDHEDLIMARRVRRVQYGLPDDEIEYDRNVDLITASPLDYHAFREDVISRFPAYVPPPSTMPKELGQSGSIIHHVEITRPSHSQPSNAQLPAPTVHLATPAPSPPLSPILAPGQKLKKTVFMTNQSFPFLFPSETDEAPKSTIEASELFSSRVRVTPANRQLWEECDIYMKQERGWTFENGTDKLNERHVNMDGAKETLDRLERVEHFYKENYSTMHSFIITLFRQILDNIIFIQADDVSDVDSHNQTEETTGGSGIDSDPVVIRSKELAVKSVSAILDLLTGWFKVSHILKFEFLAAELYDARYYLLVYKYLYSHSVLDRALNIPDSLKMNFFTICKSLSIGKDSQKYGETACRNVPLLNSSTFVADHEPIWPYSKRYFFTMINLTRVLKRIVKKKVQRIVMVAELPSDSLRKALTVYQKDLWRIVLEIFKCQVPFNGKKWKYNNMDLISAIYLHCRAKLRDEWLSRSDVSAELDDAYTQEVTIRALIQLYNKRNYVSDGSRGFSQLSNIDDLDVENLSLDE